MSKNTRPSEKARSETVSQRAASGKEKETEKKPLAASAASKKQMSEKQLSGRVSTTPSIQTSDNSRKNADARQKTVSAGKSEPAIHGIPLSPFSKEDASSQLLRRTKTTASALTQLEKGIELIHRKDFKRAIAELQSLIEKFKNETEIVAKARSYLDICRRNEARQKKTPSTTQNQTYALGVLEHNQTNYDNAIAYFRQSLEICPYADYIYYSIAASMALKGDCHAAVENLRKAVDLNRDSLVHAKNDPDFASLEDDKEFLELVGISAPRQR